MNPRRAQSTEEPPPSADELFAMAYADGELSSAARAEFERRLAREPALTRLVAEHRRLEVLTRSFAPPEPQDFEWERIRESAIGRAQRGSSWALVGLCALGIILAVGFLVFGSDLHLAVRVGIGMLALCFSVAFGTTLHAQLKLRELDPYREIQR
jgi:anti-sigma factor RsiW